MSLCFSPPCVLVSFVYTVLRSVTPYGHLHSEKSKRQNNTKKYRAFNPEDK